MPRSLTNRHIVLDLDSTLIHSSMEMNHFEMLKLYSNPRNIALRTRVYKFDLVDVVDTPGSGVRTPMWGVLRPRVYDFLIFCSTYFEKIHVWSAGRFAYVHCIKEVLFPDPVIQPSTVLTYEDCEMTTTAIFKPLERLHSKPTAIGADPSNTLALDDREDTFSLNPLNGIQIPPYEPQPTMASIMTDDIALLQLQCWLSLPEVVKSRDVQTLNKRSIFTTPLSDYQSLLYQTLHTNYTPSFSKGLIMSENDLDYQSKYETPETQSEYVASQSRQEGSPRHEVTVY